MERVQDTAALFREMRAQMATQFRWTSALIMAAWVTIIAAVLFRSEVKAIDWVKVAIFTLAGLVVAGTQYFLVYQGAPPFLRILAPSVFALSYFVCGILAGGS